MNPLVKRYKKFSKVAAENNLALLKPGIILVQWQFFCHPYWKPFNDAHYFKAY
jgi:hypothetical protein